MCKVTHTYLLHSLNYLSLVFAVVTFENFSFFVGRFSLLIARLPPASIMLATAAIATAAFVTPLLGAATATAAAKTTAAATLGKIMIRFGTETAAAPLGAKAGVTMRLFGPRLGA